MENICRICLSDSQILVNIFEQREASDGLSLSEMVNECADCQLRSDDNLPKMICTGCTQDARTAYAFKRRCEQSYKLLTMKAEKKEFDVDLDAFCDMLEKENWELPKRYPDEDCVKVEAAEVQDEAIEDEEECPPNTPPTSELVENSESNEKPTSREILQENISTSLTELVDAEAPAARYPARQIKRHNYGALDEDHGSDISDEEDGEELATSDNSDDSKELSDKTQRNERPHRCPECPKTFNRRENLKAHSRTHSGERPFKCPHCPKVFAQSHHARDHIHLHSGQRPHQCPHCPKAFTQKSNLRAHIYVHSREGAHKCTQCSKCFARNYDLKVHLRVHTGDRPYKCGDCAKSFNRRRDLERHIRTHTGEQPFKCTH
ncbi:hypothetical protein KR222_005086, partial [Zaprionus bogoriensis]